MKNYIKIFLLCCVLCSAIYVNAQCNETVENFSFHNPEFKSVNSIYFNPIIDKDSSIIYGANTYLIKQSKTGNIGWVKNIPKFQSFYTTEDNKILGIYNTDTIGPGSGYGGGIVKLLPDGNLEWAKKISIPDSVFSYWGSAAITKGKDGDIILSNNYYDEIGIVLFDKNVTRARFTKHLKLQLSPGNFLVHINTAVVNNSIFILCNVQKDEPPYLYSNHLLLIKLNYETGVTEKVRYLQFDDELKIPTSQYITSVVRGSFNDNLAFRATGDNYLIVAGRKGTNAFDNNRLFAMKIDTALNVKKYGVFTAKEHRYFYSSNYLTTLPSINNRGSVLFSNIRGYDVWNLRKDSSFLLLTDDDLNIVAERKLSLSDDVQLPGSYQLNSVPLLKDNGDMSIVFHTVSADAGLMNIVNIPSGMPDLPCRGDNADYITTEMPGFTDLPEPDIKILTPFDVTIALYNGLEVYDGSIEVNKFCVQKSICDTIRILSQTDFCVVGDTAVFLLVKNPQCLRNARWKIESDAVEIISRADSLLKVKFLKPYSGYIKATFDNCDLADSVYVKVSERLQPFSLGRDTTLCPTNSYIIHATAGYTDYLWSNGDTADSIVVSAPGTYKAKARDFCGKTHYATKVISGLSKKFSIDYTGSICGFDTATILTDPAFRNYQFTPASKGLIEDNHIILYPESTTQYTISAEAFPGCVVRDSVTITVDNCSSEIIFPNAFSPNNDGLNDEFKPVVIRKLKIYRLSVYNRFGQIVFQSADPAKGWNGWFRSQPVDQGIYTWVCEYSFPGLPQKQKKGTLFLIR